METETIAAPATPPGRGGIALIRISGPHTLHILRRIAPGLPPVIKPRRAYRSRIVHDGRPIDDGLAIYYRAPRSYTGEDAAEISLHANPFIVEEVLNIILAAFPGAVREALPGEFTYRAFQNGKIDLLQAEAVNELINANSKYYAHMTFNSLEGKLSRFMAHLKQNLLELGVRIETCIEFQEDQFFGEIPLRQYIREPLEQLETLLGNARFNERLNRGLSVVIAGKVNVGKSSLFNTLLMEERSIISSAPGTTRDFIREKLYVDGFPIDINDVAGMNRDAGDEIEAEGIRRSLGKIADCDAAVFMLDASRPLESADFDIYRLIRERRRLIIINKTDIAPPDVAETFREQFPGEQIHEISVRKHVNISVVARFLEELVRSVGRDETEFAVNQRQTRILEELRQVLRTVLDMAEQHISQTEIMAEEIRRGLDLIGQLLGEITPDDVLNRIFSTFCIGK